jgi:SAM-dependent methyltransferase
VRPDTESLNRHYSEFYANDAETEWRELGAKQKARSVTELVGVEPIASVVDVGCGEGSVIALLQADLPDARFLGLEVSAAAIEAARQRSYDADVDFALFDGVKIPEPDDSYELGILSHVVEHVADPRALIMETARVARRIVVEVPLELHARTSRYRWDDTGHINIYNRRSIVYLIESCGLCVIRERTYYPGREAQTFFGARGSTLKALVKAAALHVGGQALFTYHYAAFATRAA